MLANPFVTYIVAFGACIAIYYLGWSSIYPPLSWSVLLFFAATFALAAVFANLVSPLLPDGPEAYKSGLLHRYTGLIVVGTFLAEFILAGWTVPILIALSGKSMYLFEATTTHLHAFVLWSVYSVIRFADFMYSRRRLYLIEASLPVIFYVLMLYRGPLLIVLLSWMFVFIVYHGGVRFKHAAITIALILGALFVNGVLGNVRSPGGIEYAGKPTQAFRDSGISRTYFWAYLYSTVGLANFQLQVDKITEPQGSVTEFIATDLVPDTISKRIMHLVNPAFDLKGQNLITRDQLYSWPQPQVGPGLTISTIYGRAYGYFLWFGPMLMFALLSAFIAVYLLVVRHSPYRVPCIAMLNTLVVFCLFNNMLVSAAMIPLLVLPLLLPPWKWIWTSRFSISKPD